MYEAKKKSKVKLAGTLLRVVGITLAAGIALIAATDKVMTKATKEKDEAEDDEE